MPIFQGKRFRFANDPMPVIPIEGVSAAEPRTAGRGIKRNFVLGLTVIAPLFVFSLFHPGSQSVNPISRADAAASAEAASAPAEQTALALATTHIKGLSRLGADVDPRSGEVRELFGLGTLSGADPLLRLDFRAHADRAKSGGFVTAVADSAGKIGAVVRKLGASQTAATARGPLEWADLTLTTSTGPRSCFAFRMAPSDDKRLTGLLCGPNGMRPEVAALPCVVEKLDLARSAQSDGFERLLRGQAAQKANCRNSPV